MNKGCHQLAKSLRNIFQSMTLSIFFKMAHIIHLWGQIELAWSWLNCSGVLLQGSDNMCLFWKLKKNTDLKGSKTHLFSSHFQIGICMSSMPWDTAETPSCAFYSDMEVQIFKAKILFPRLLEYILTKHLTCVFFQRWVCIKAAVFGWK